VPLSPPCIINPAEEGEGVWPGYAAECCRKRRWEGLNDEDSVVPAVVAPDPKGDPP